MYENDSNNKLGASFQEILDEFIERTVCAVEQGNTGGLTAVIKKTPTPILKASENHPETRYCQGSELVTYTGIDEDGSLVQETWGGGVAVIKDDSVILRNADPITYPEGHELAGQEVRGDYNDNGTFVVDQENGSTILFNEYVSDTEFVKSAYGVEATEEWQTGLKLQPSYVFQIPSVKVTTQDGVEINLSSGDSVVIDAKKGKVTSVHGIESKWLEKTYKGLDAHLKSLQE